MELAKILVAVDGSDFSNQIIEVAIKYAKLFGSRLLLVYCHHP
jgi:nucleotide-binding universal stress UspA family protein